METSIQKFEKILSTTKDEKLKSSLASKIDKLKQNKTFTK